ncbi:serpin family protein [Aquisphaera insulae]|uniref:serpin family protein n=1 Tax=Aquisphaera insulae TaxID=2712864 RepID=UPI0013EB88F4|nr:serpin family protein [Aquisphaera insulae]
MRRGPCYLPALVLALGSLPPASTGAAAAAPAPGPGTLPEAVRRAVERQNQFARTLLRAASDASPRENGAVAPLAVAEVLDLLREAAAAATAEELTAALGPPGARAPLRDVDPSRPIVRPRLSATLANNDGYGVKVIGLPDDSPEARAGLRAGDLILGFQGRPVRSRARLDEAAGKAEPGLPVAIQVYSYEPGTIRDLKVILANETDSMPGLSAMRALWVQSGSPLPQAFRASAREAHGLPLREVDFRERTDDARQAIDAWLSQGARIAAVDPPDISADTRLLFVDRLALHAAWQRPFPAASPGEFRTIDGAKVAALLMRQEGLFPLVERERYRMLDLPLHDGRYSFAIVLPDAPDGPLPEATELATAIAASRATLVDVVLPRFTLEASRRLDADLAAMGVRRAFSDDAEFPGLGPGGPWKLGAIRQAIRLDVEEAGVKAEAVTTAAGVTIRGDRPEPKAFHADRPFYFLVVDRPTGLILLAGRKVR